MTGPVENLHSDTISEGTTTADISHAGKDSGVVNPFLIGNYTPMKSELTLTDLSVTGTIPAELDGRYIRIGGNPITQPNPAAYHVFMGDGMVHGVRLKDGKALWYRNRWIRSHIVSQTLGEPPAPGPHEPPFDLVNTNVLGHAGATWALVEAGGCPVRIDEDLNTIAYDPFAGTLKGGSYTAHPHGDPKTGELHAICYTAGNMTDVRHVVVDTNGKVRREEPILVPDGPSIHECMITENYVIILDMPVTVSMELATSGKGLPFVWNTNHKARVGLLPKEGRGEDTIWCEVEPCYVFHAFNAFENPDGTVTMDSCVHDKVFAVMTSGVDSQAIPFERWHIDPVAKKVTRMVIDPESQDFPRVNETRMGLPYRYAYSVALPLGGDPSFPEDARLLKHDLEAGTRQVHDFGKGHIVSEFAFVPAANASAEDHGWVMGYVLDIASQTTELVILNTQDFEGAPQATIKIPHRIPPGFHGNWVPTQAAK